MHTAIEKIIRPALLINRLIVNANLQRLQSKLHRSGIRLRPHVKTHQSLLVGEWLREAGITAITASSLQMAQYFAGNGWRDILVAFPFNLREIELANQLAADIRLGLFVEAPQTILFLKNKLRHPIDIWLKIDSGYKRSGISATDTEAIAGMAALCRDPLLRLRGIATHAGHTYAATSAAEVQEIYRDSLQKMAMVGGELARRGIAVEISTGDTPSALCVPDFGDIDEFRPGNFLYLDLMQWSNGHCDLDDIAVAAACPIVACHPQRRELVLMGGAVHLSKDMIYLPDGRPCFGLAVEIDQQTGHWHPESGFSPLTKLSQEHGIVSCTAAMAARHQPGDLLGVLPVHSCLTANLLREVVEV